MSRVSGAIKSLLSGISTIRRDKRANVHLEEQINMLTTEVDGLQRRPAAEFLRETVSNETTTLYNTTKNSNDLSDIAVIQPGEFGGLNPVIVRINGVIVPVVAENEYLIDAFNKDDIAVVNIDDTNYVLNKKRQIKPQGEGARGFVSSMVQVLLSPFDGEVLTFSFTQTDGAIISGSITASGTPAARGTRVVAQALQVAMDAARTDPYNANVAGSVVSLDTLQDTSNLSVTDQSNGATLLATNEYITDVSKLPAYAQPGAVLQVTDETLNEKAAVYVQARPINGREINYANPIANLSPFVTNSFAVQDPAFDFLTDRVRIVGIVTVPTVDTPSTFGTFTTDNFGAVTGTLRTLTAMYIMSDSVSDLQTFVLEVTGNDFDDLKLDTIHLEYGVNRNVLEPVRVSDTRFEVLLPETYSEQFAGNAMRLLVNVTDRPDLSDPMEAVIWEECAKPGVSIGIDRRTMPQQIDTQGATPLLLSVDWKNRTAGNNLNNPHPKFVNHTIQDLTRFQNRWLAISQAAVQTTQTEENDEEKFEWYRDTTSILLATHPVRIRTTSVEADTMHHMVQHNRDLLIFDRDSQFKISGRIPLTPQTASITLTTSYENLENVKPISIGKDVYFVFKDGTTNGLRRYQQTEDTLDQDLALDLTAHARKYITDDIVALAGSPTQELLFVATATEIYVCKFQAVRVTNESLVFAWSKWNSWNGEEAIEIQDIKVSKDSKLIVAYKTQTPLGFITVLSSFDLANQTEVYLDHKVDVQGLNGDTVLDLIPSLASNPMQGFTNSQTRTLNKEANSIRPLFGATFAQRNYFAPLTQDTVMTVGTTFESSVIPTNPRTKDPSGLINSFSKLTILNWLIHLENSADVYASIISPYYTFEDKYWSGLIAGDLNTFTDTTADNSGTFVVGFKQTIKSAILRIFSNGHLPMNITQIEWLGNFKTRGSRF